MASSNLLKEAIADAKAVRETAIANAKLALEEAFTPKLQSMLSNKIEEELDENEELEEQSDSSNIGAGDNKVNQSSGDDYEKDETEKASGDPGTEDSNVKVVDKLTEADEDEDKEVKEDDEEDEGHVPGHDDEDSEDHGDDDMDMELEAIIKELEDEDSEMKEDEEDHSEMKEDEDEDKEVKEVAKDEKSEADEDEKDEMKEDVEDIDEELNIESILQALKEDDDDEDTELKEEDEDEKDEMYKEQLEEAYDTIRSLKSTLNEVNLLNAKLLFSNKLFKSQNLTESQKLRVIETFDRAQSLREVKLVYTTLAESMKNPVNKTKKLRTEGLASKAQKTTKPKTVITEGNEMASRMKKLAGLL